MKTLMIYYFVFAIWYLLSLLPFRVHYLFSNIIFVLIFHVFHYRRRTVWVNVVTSFPELEPEDHKAIEKNFYKWFCDYLVESIKLMTMSREQLKRRMVFKGTEQIEACVKDGQSCAIYLGHYCNWEWITSLPLWISDTAQCGQIYHPLENKDFDRLFLKIRQRMGAVCIPMAETLRRILMYKREGKPVVIGYIADQGPFWWNIHHWLPFLHHDTAVLTGTERIAKKAGHAVFYMEVSRVKRGYYEAEFKLITREPQKYNDYELTDKYFELLEKSIRREPYYWLWTHDRWKRTRERFERMFIVKDGKVHELPKNELQSYYPNT